MAIAILATTTRADAADPPNASASVPRTVEVRLAMSPPCAARLDDKHVRRLLELELQDIAVVAPGAGGPLGDYVAYVWMDLPNEGSVVIEVRIGDKPVARREVQIKGLIGDVAARLAAIGASAMIRAQTLPPKPVRKPEPPPPPTYEELQRPLRSLPTPMFSARGLAVWLPDAHGGFFGPSIAVGVRMSGLSVEAFGSVLSGSVRDAPSAIRIVDAGLAVRYRAWLSGDLRFAFGVEGAGQELHGLAFGDGGSKSGDDWNARAGVSVGLEGRLADVAWLGLSLDPSVLLNRDHFASDTSDLGGAWLGADLSLTFERPTVPRRSPATAASAKR